MSFERDRWAFQSPTPTFSRSSSWGSTGSRSRLEINAGYHFGKVNTLEDGFHVGQILPSGVTDSAVQKKKFDSAIYFGIAVNRDAFDRIFRNSGN